MSESNGSDRREFLACALSLGSLAAGAGLLPREALAQPLGLSGSGNAESSLELLYDPSLAATGLRGDAADRLALRRLIDAWAHCADRRLATQQAGLFTPDGVIHVYPGDPATHSPVSTVRGRADIVTALAVLGKYTVTTHFNGQSDVVLNGDRAAGENYCLAHQLWEEGGQRKLQVLSIRYQDNMLRQEGRWYFTERKLLTDWSETRTIS